MPGIRLPGFFPSLYWRSQLGGKKYKPTVWYRINDWSTRLIPRTEFDYDRVLARSLAWTNLDKEPGYKAVVPDEEHWRKLCKNLVAKHPQFSNYGAQLMMDKLVRSLGGRLLVDKLYADNKEEIERFTIHEPIFVLGLPRSNASMATHIQARSGYFLSLRMRDAMFPGVPSELERRALGRKVMQDARRVHPQLLAIMHLDPELPESDVAIQLMNPKALAWGMLHGLPDYLYECLSEDQEHVYDFMAKVMKLFQWYRQCGEFSDCVVKECNEIWRPEMQVVEGRKLALEKMPWLIHSPFSILHVQQLHKVFPDMRVIWCHRAVSPCVASMCSAIAIHNTVHTGRSLTQAQLGQIGEQVCGIFGSGSEHAVDYMEKFPYERMVHWHNKDISRSGIRLLTKTLDAFGMDRDRFRNQQAIDGNTEWNEMFRPRNICVELSHFGLHEGIVGEHFQVYMKQFKQYAFESKFGARIDDYPWMSVEFDKRRFVTGEKEDKRQLQTSFVGLQTPGKHSFADPMNRTADGRYRATGPHE